MHPSLVEERAGLLVIIEHILALFPGIRTDRPGEVDIELLAAGRRLGNGQPPIIDAQNRAQGEAGARGAELVEERCVQAGHQSSASPDSP